MSGMLFGRGTRAVAAAATVAAGPGLTIGCDFHRGDFLFRRREIFLRRFLTRFEHELPESAMPARCTVVLRATASTVDTEQLTGERKRFLFVFALRLGERNRVVGRELVVAQELQGHALVVTAHLELQIQRPN